MNLSPGANKLEFMLTKLWRGAGNENWKRKEVKELKVFFLHMRMKSTRFVTWTVIWSLFEGFIWKWCEFMSKRFCAYFHCTGSTLFKEKNGIHRIFLSFYFNFPPSFLPRNVFYECSLITYNILKIHQINFFSLTFLDNFLHDSFWHHFCTIPWTSPENLQSISCLFP